MTRDAVVPTGTYTDGEPLGTDLQEAVLDRAPGFADWMVVCLFGGTYQRGVLADRDRQVATLAALVTLGSVEPQLTGHVRTALRLGMTAEEVTEVVVHLAPYVGTPRTLAALRCVRAAVDG